MIFFLFIFCCVNFALTVFITSRFLLRIEKLESIVFELSADDTYEIIESEDFE